MQKAVKLTPSGYPAGKITDSYGQKYKCLPSGSLVREGGKKLSKAERKRWKKKIQKIREAGKGESDAL